MRNVAGDRAEVTVLLPPNADPHEFETYIDMMKYDVQAIVEALK